MSAVDTSYHDYFTLIRDFRTAPDWQQTMMLRGVLLNKCNDMKPVSARHRLRRFWQTETAKRGMDVGQLQTWG